MLHDATAEMVHLHGWHSRCHTFILSGATISILAFVVQYSEGKQGVPQFQAALEPLRQTLTKYPFLGGNISPSYADIIVFGFFMVRILCHLL